MHHSGRPPCDYATISFNSMRRARSTLEDFFLSYPLFQGLGQEALWPFMHLLVFVEATL
jgi:hypothetical protein